MKTSQLELDSILSLGYGSPPRCLSHGYKEVRHHSQVAVARDSQNEWVLHLCKSAASAHRLLAIENLSDGVRS
jgi:hypothetical protein